MIASGLALLAFAIVTVGQGARFFARSEIIEAHFRRINGLQAGAPVTLSGVHIGAVDSIYFPTEPAADYVIVRMWVERSAVERVRADSVAQINTMGLLGDKFVELSSGTAESPMAEPGQVLAARDPIDLETLLQKKGTDDLVANVIAISNSTRSLLETLDKGQGILSELIRGTANGAEQDQLTVASIRKTLDSVNQLSVQMTALIGKMNRGEGLAGAMLSNETDGRELLTRVSRAADAIQSTSDRLNKLITRFENSRGLAARFLQDEPLADEVLSNLKQSTTDLKEILHKINAGQGTAGQLVNDPSLYYEIKSMFSGGTGWGLRLYRGVRGALSPFSSFESEPIPMSPAPPPQLGSALMPPASMSMPAASPSTLDASAAVDAPSPSPPSTPK
ncbi:MAG: MlaD family protein [Candidatus Binataceae bacterium]